MPLFQHIFRIDN